MLSLANGVGLTVAPMVVEPVDKLVMFLGPARVFKLVTIYDDCVPASSLFWLLGESFCSSRQI